MSDEELEAKYTSLEDMVRVGTNRAQAVGSTLIKDIRAENARRREELENA